MGVQPQPRQPPSDVVRLRNWELDEDNPFGQGAKPKRFLICPNPADHRYLLGGHRYVFKEPGGAKAQQIWSEVIAYELAKLSGVCVPPAFLAYDPHLHSPGVLIEFFFGHLWDPPTRFVHAIERFQGRGIAIDERRGSLRDNIDLCRFHGVQRWRVWWAETLALDALIGNTDRHSENWGFLITQGAGGRLQYVLAPAFDNGTSLGAIIQDADLAKYEAPQTFARFIAKGEHHYSWVPSDRKSAGHAALCGYFVRRYPETRPVMERVVKLDDSAIDDILEWCTRFDFPVRFTPERATFVGRVLRARRDAILAAIGA